MFSSVDKVTAPKLCRFRSFSTLDRSKMAAIERMIIPKTLKMKTSDFTAKQGKICQARSASAHDRSQMTAYEKMITPEALTTSEFIAKYGCIWENDNQAFLSPRAVSYVKRRFRASINMVIGSNENIKVTVESLKQSLKGMLVPPATTSPLLKLYTSFIDNLDKFTDLHNIPDEFQSVYLRKGLKYLSLHPIMWNRKYGTGYVPALLLHGPDIEVTGSADTSPGLIKTSRTQLDEYFNMCSAKNDPERFYYIGSDLEGIKNSAIRDSLRAIANPPKDFRFVKPFEILKVYNSHTRHDRNIKSPIILSDEELREDLGPIFLSCWDYVVARGEPYCVEVGISFYYD